MLILNPLEPWPSNLLLPACEKKGIKVLTRVVDYGGVFHDDEDKIKDFGKMPDVRFTAEEIEAIRQIGDNTGCMKLKGASNRHAISERCDEKSS